MIEISHLEKSFGDTKVLEDVSICIPDGKIYGLVGVSGAGKSTLLRCINGLEPFDEGTLLVDSADISAMSREELRSFRSSVGMIFQQFSLLERKTVLQNVELPMKCHGVSREERQLRAMEVLELVGLAAKANAKPRELSGGQKQRVAIARALAMRPKVLLCDEATSALDPAITREILRLLRQINQDTGITVIVVTHQMSVVKEVCDAATILEHGKVSYDGSVDELFLKRPDALKGVLGAGLPYSIEEGQVAYNVIQREDSKDILSRIAIETGVAYRVAWGGLDTYKGTIAGSFVLVVDDADSKKIEAWLDEQSGVEYRTILFDEDAEQEPAEEEGE